MKPCAKNQKLISWLAIDALDAPSEQKLRTHLETCDGCRQYLTEMRHVTGQLAAAEPKSEVRASESFHQTWMARVKREAPAGTWGWDTAVWEQIIRRPGQNIKSLFKTMPRPWRLAFSVAIILVFSLRIWIEQSPPTVVPMPLARSESIPAVAKLDATADLAPTIVNYQRAASQSLDKLDDLLFRQEKPADRSAPICTASAMSLNF